MEQNNESNNTPDKYRIMGKYRGRTEELDSTDSKANAKYMVHEYQLAFGAGWSVWIKEE